ncbi:MAG: glycosyltransferase [Candidatus Methylacidiphilales bacterium]
MSRCDLQVHSCYSDRPSEWVLRKLGMPESFTRPREAYERLRAAGMDLITLTDHNRLDGCLEIRELPGVFLSEEVTTYFPEDGCKVHLLVWNLTEAQHKRIQELRANLYDLGAYLRDEGLAHGVAHPLFSLNGRLTADHFEKLILHFRTFEGLNGTREPLAQEVASLILSQLTEAQTEALAERHKMKSPLDRPWEKSLFGSSDDHGGLYLAGAWTRVEGDHTPESFLQAVMNGKAEPGGRPGDALRFSNSIYHIILTFARDRLGNKAPRGLQLLGKVAERFLQGQNPTDIPVGEKIAHLAEAVMTGKAFEFLNPNDPSFNRQVALYFLDPRVKTRLDEIIASEREPERRVFRMASQITNDLSYKLFQQFLARVHKGELVESLQPVTGLLPIAASVAPYAFSFHSLHSNRPFLETTARRFLAEVPEFLRNTKRAWFTDTLEDVNGVARTIRTMSLSAKKRGAGLVTVTSRSQITITDIPIKNFIPVGEFELPEYELQKLSFPPFLEIVDYLEKERFTECIISTPGPIGLCALAAAKILGLRTVGIYHTDFPQYVRILTEDDFLETVAWKFMHWFYAQLDLVYVNSNFYRQCWIERGIAPDKLEILPRGLDTELFHPKRRDPNFWPKRGADGPVVLYVGRISKEKDLALLIEIDALLKARGVRFQFALVGEGPYRRELQAALPDALFTGILTGPELGQAYASADLFIFPSTTDTFGNVVVEAFASGLPVLVSDIGGPRELVEGPHMGRVLPAHHATLWADAIADLLAHPIPSEQLVRNANQMQVERSWDRAFDAFWARGLSA